jgi:hypothetical protein
MPAVVLGRKAKQGDKRQIPRVESGRNDRRTALPVRLFLGILST